MTAAFFAKNCSKSSSVTDFQSHLCFQGSGILYIIATYSLALYKHMEMYTAHRDSKVLFSL